MARAKLTVYKSGYRRKGFIAHRKGKTYHVKPTYIPPTEFKIKDVGAVGRGEKIIPKLKKGTLGGKGFFKKSKEEQKRLAFNIARHQGEKKAVHKLIALEVFFKRTHPSYSKRAKKLAHEVAGSFKGTRQISYPSGLKRKI
jgi:hypothetical protein